MSSTIEVRNVWMEKLFEYFYFSVMFDGGDGSAILCCGNPQATAEEFLSWWEDKKLPLRRAHVEGMGFGWANEEFHPRSTYHWNGVEIIDYGDANEHFMFCERYLELPHGDTSFIVREDCSNCKGDFKVKAL